MSEAPTPKKPFEPRLLLLPGILFVVALLIRLPGITWGLKDEQHNQSLHPDEEVNFRVTRAIEPAHLSFTPGFYRYGTLYLTAMRVAEDVAYGYSGGSEHPEGDWDYIRTGELAGRVVSALAGSLLCVVAYFTSLRFTSKLGACAAAATLAVAPGLAVHSRFATVDVFATLFVALAALYAVRLLLDENPPWIRCAILGGICAGSSAGTKYTGGLALLMPLAAIVLRRPAKPLLLGAASIVASLAAFVVSTPGCLLDTQRFVQDVTDEMKHVAIGHGMVFTGTSSGFLYHLSNLFLGVGILLTLLGIGGLIWAAITKQRWAWVVLAFALPYYVVIGRQEVKFLRYTFPLTVALAAGVGYAVGEGDRRSGGYRSLVALGILGIGGLDAGGLRGAWLFTSAMTATDNREKVLPIVTRYGSTAPSGHTVGLISDPWFWSPTLYRNITMGPMYPLEVRMRLMRDTGDPKVVRYLPTDGSKPEPYDPRLVTETKPDFIAYSDFETIYVERVSKMARVPDDFGADVERYKAFRSALESNYELVAQFGPSGNDMVEDMRYVLPAVYVWKRKL